MSKQVAIKLIRSLSGSEKRFFKLYAKRQSVNRTYIDLFHLIEAAKVKTEHHIDTEFRKKHPSASLHNTARYLVKILTDCLIKMKMEKDSTFQLFQSVMRVKILQERSLSQESYAALQKITTEAHRLQQPMFEYLSYREQLNYLADQNFAGAPDKLLVEIQMKAKGLLRDLNSIHDHHSLFELLQHRLVNAGKISSAEQMKQLNDLVLSEMALVSNRPVNSFVAQKLHLLFQSFYFTNIGDYKSALKTFAALNDLFEKNSALLNHPPLDYLSALNGILDSLHNLEYFDQMGFYISKTEHLDQAPYPEYFRSQVQKTTVLYQVIFLISKQNYQQAIDTITIRGKDWLRNYQLVDEEKQWELYFNISRCYFELKHYKKAHQWLNDLLQYQDGYKHWLICKAARLLNIIVYYERGEREYLVHEIKSYKNFFGKDNLLQTETTLFLFLSTKKGLLSGDKNDIMKMPPLLSSVRQDRFEKQLLKHFDIMAWIQQKLTPHV